MNGSGSATIADSSSNLPSGPAKEIVVTKNLAEAKAQLFLFIFVGEALHFCNIDHWAIFPRNIKLGLPRTGLQRSKTFATDVLGQLIERPRMAADSAIYY